MTAVTALSAVLPLGLLLGGGSTTVALAVVVINGFMSGVKFPGIVYLVSRYFGARSFGTLYGTVSIASSVSSGLGPLLGNYVYDVTRSYVPVLWAAIPAIILASLLFAALGRSPEFREKEALPT